MADNGPKLTNSYGGLRPQYLAEVGTDNHFGNGYQFGAWKREIAKLQMRDKVRAGDLSEFEEAGKKAIKVAPDTIYALAAETLNRYTGGVGYRPVELFGIGGCPQHGGEPHGETKYPKYTQARAKMAESDADPKARRRWVEEHIPPGVAGYWLAACNEVIQNHAAGGRNKSSDYNPYKAVNNPMRRLARLGAI